MPFADFFVILTLKAIKDESTIFGTFVKKHSGGAPPARGV